MVTPNTDASLPAELTSSARGRLRWPSWDFLALLACLIAVHLPFVANASVIGTHDTFYALLIFHFFYSNLLHLGHLPLWVPQAIYGMPSLYFQMQGLTPGNYLALFGGYLLGINDVLCLFKAALFLDFLVFFVGLYALARQVCRQRASVILICFVAIVAPVYYSQIFMTFRMYYILPYVLYLLLAFVRKCQAHYLWLAGVCVICSLFGNIGYFSSVYFLTLTLFMAPLLYARPQALRSLLTFDLKALAALLLFAAVTGIYFTAWHGAAQGFHFSSPGRDPRTGQVALDVFLHYARIEPELAATIYTLGWPLMLEANLYIGILPWLLLAWGAGHARTDLFLALVLPAIVLFALAASEGSATLIYCFPLMCYYRHRCYVYSIFNLLLLLCAGLALDDILTKPLQRTWRFVSLALLAVMGAGLMLALRRQYPETDVNTFVVGSPNWPGQHLFWVRMALYVAAFALSVVFAAFAQGQTAKQATVILFAVALVGDLASYQILAMNAFPVITPTQHDRFQIRPATYVASRMQRAFDASPPDPSTLYVLQYQLEGIDPYEIATRIEIASDRTGDLLKSRGHQAVPKGSEDLSLQRAFAHQTAKLRLCKSVRWAKDADELNTLLAGNPDIDESPILRGVREVQEALNAEDQRASVQAIEVLSFKADELIVKVLVEGTEPRWLYYADSYHPAWRATLNDEEVPIYEANLAFKAVEVFPGENVVHFHFAGFLATASSVIACTGCLFYLSCMIWVIPEVTAPWPRTVAPSESPAGQA